MVRSTAPGFAAMIPYFPYGKAPLWILAVAVTSSLLQVVTARERPPRPDLVLVTFTDAHAAAYEAALPEFERRHGVDVQIQKAHWRALRSRLQNAMLAGAEVPDMVEMFQGSLGFFTRGPVEDVGFLELTPRLDAERLRERMVESRFTLWSHRERIYGLPHDVHPVALAYRRDLVEALGIDVSTLRTWDDFVAVGRRVTRDLNQDGVIDRYMLDLPYSGAHGLSVLMYQRGAQLFDAEGRVAFNDEVTAEVFTWYLHQTLGPQRIAYDCGWEQPQIKAMHDGLALFFLTPDWRTYNFQEAAPKLAGKMALMPLPAWEPGGRRTSVWGGTGLVITRQSQRPDLAWELAKFLYFNPEDMGERFLVTNIIPPLREAWELPEFERPSAYYSGQPLGRVYAELAPETPPVYGSAEIDLASSKVNEAYTRVVEHYKSRGDTGLREVIRAELDRAEDYVQRKLARNAF